MPLADKQHTFSINCLSFPFLLYLVLEKTGIALPATCGEILSHDWTITAFGKGLEDCLSGGEFHVIAFISAANWSERLEDYKKKTKT